MDSVGEEFAANAIEAKCSYHGRRNDELFVQITEPRHEILQKGAKLIKSAKTVLLRAKPRNVRTVEGKQLFGKWLFSSRKPAKNESVHYNRAAVKLVRQEMYEAELRHLSFSRFEMEEEEESIDKRELQINTVRDNIKVIRRTDH